MSKESWGYILSGSIVAGFFLALVALFCFNIPQENRELIYILMGALVAFMSTIKDFFFGSSQGSKDKDEKKGG